MKDACDIITSTMGFKGRSVLIKAQGGAFHTVDGATVAGYIKGQGTTGEMGVKLVQQACWRTRDEARDGTTTTAALIRGLLPFINDYHPVEFEEKLNRFEERVLELLEEETVDFTLEQVALTSAHGMEDIAYTIADAVKKVGEFGTLDYENGFGKIRAEFHDGYFYPEKPLSMHFGRVDYIDPMVLIIEQKIEHHSDLLPIYRTWNSINQKEKAECDRKQIPFAPRPLVIFASDIYGSALDMALANFKAGTPIVIIKTPVTETGEQKVQMCQDIQFITGTHKVFSYFSGLPLTNFGKTLDKKDMNVMNEFGTAQRIISNEKGTIIHFAKKDVGEYTKEWEDNEFNTQRKARLTCGVGTIFVGGETVVEQEYRAHLIDDTIGSCFASRKGVIRGGGLPLYQIGERLKDSFPFAVALQEPRKTIMKNANLPEDTYFTGKFEPRDTLLAVQSAVKNSISVIKTISNVERVLSDAGEGLIKNY